jgi:FkbM family methyltransferase
MKRFLESTLRISAVVLPVWLLLIVLYFPAVGFGKYLLSGSNCNFWESLKVPYGGFEDRVNSHIADGNLLETDGRFELWQTRDADYWIPKGSSFWLFLILAEQDQEIYGQVQPGETVLDCGAHVGTFARKALESGAEKVIAIEPSPDHLECLRRNFEDAISAGKLILYPKGVWHERDVLPLVVPEVNTGAASVKDLRLGGRIVEDIELTTIDEMVRELHLPRVDFIKMDIEGSEVNAVLGAKTTLARFRPRMAIAAYHHRSDPEVIPRIVLTYSPEYEVNIEGCVGSGQFVRRQTVLFR